MDEHRNYFFLVITTSIAMTTAINPIRYKKYNMQQS